MASAAVTARVSTTPISTGTHSDRREGNAGNSVLMLARAAPTRPESRGSVGQVARAAHGTPADGQADVKARSRATQRARGFEGRWGDLGADVWGVPGAVEDSSFVWANASAT